MKFCNRMWDSPLQDLNNVSGIRATAINVDNVREKLDFLDEEGTIDVGIRGSLVGIQ